MAEDAWTQDELFEGLAPSQGFISELERLLLLVVVGRDAQGRSLYARESREELEKVLALVDLGYQLDDIAAIATRVGLPLKRRGRFRRPPIHLTRIELAQRADITTEQLDTWVEAGLVIPRFKRDGPGALYVVDAVTRVQRLRDLTLLGVSMAELETWTVALDHLDTRRAAGALSDEEGQAVDAALSALQVRLNALSSTTRRWGRLMTTLKRRFAKLRPSNARGRGKRRLRTRTRR
jgi:DNA-binding transcriptional MerR regulator